MVKKMSKNVCHFAMHPRFPFFSSPFSFTLGFLGAAGVFPVFFIPRFWLLASFFPWMGGRFCSAGDWAVFLTFWELLVHFSFTFLVASCVFTMAVKGHSRFWLSHRLLVSRTGYLGHFSLLWVVLTVFFALGLLSSSRFCVSCGVQVLLGPLWSANLLVVFSSVHAGGFLTLRLGLCIVAVVSIVKLGWCCYPGLGVVAELSWPR